MFKLVRPHHQVFDHLPQPEFERRTFSLIDERSFTSLPTHIMCIEEISQVVISPFSYERFEKHAILVSTSIRERERVSFIRAIKRSNFQEAIHGTNLQTLTNKQINVVGITFSVCMT